MISIITTLYNYKHFIPELADSIFKQTYSDWEWIIVDDASTDDPMTVLTHLVNDDRIRIFRLEENKGYSFAKNVGIRASSGEYITMIDADDVLTENSLYNRLNELIMHPNVMWVHGDALNYNEDGDIEETYIRWNTTKRKQLLEQGWDLSRQYHHRLIHAQTVMMRREFYEQLGLYDETLRFSSDNEMWRRAIRFGYIPRYIPTPVAIYRAHPDRMSRSAYKKQRIQEVKKYILEIVERRFKEGINAANTPILRS